MIPMLHQGKIMLKKDDGYYIRTSRNDIGQFGTYDQALEYIKKMRYKNIEYKIILRTTTEKLCSTIKMEA